MSTFSASAHLRKAGPEPERPTSEQAGSTQISSNVLNKALSAVAADALGLNVSQVSSQVADDAGKLSVSIKSPLPWPKDAVGQTAFDVIDRVRAATKERAEQLTGSKVGAINYELTGIVIPESSNRGRNLL